MNQQTQHNFTVGSGVYNVSATLIGTKLASITITNDNKVIFYDWDYTTNVECSTSFGRYLYLLAITNLEDKLC